MGTFLKDQLGYHGIPGRKGDSDFLNIANVWNNLPEKDGGKSSDLSDNENEWSL